jgi:integration host factor subunit alpha|tara:strand:+ start:728 stop:1012 length:285 start_codon:yes stop_codon:yes gene_type:complete
LNNINKKNFIKDLSIQTGFSTNLTKKIIEDLIAIFIREIKTGNLNIKNIGSFKLIKKRERIGRNPKTKETFLISARKSISFTASQKISKDLNKN